MEMDAMTFITPMKVWDTAADLLPGKENQAGNNEPTLFKDIFHNVVDQVYAAEKDLEQKQYLLAAGKLDDVNSLPIAQAKAALSLDVLISLRNKAMESYNELIKMSI